MSALDKLNAKANITSNKEEDKTEKKVAPKKQPEKAVKQTTEKKTKTTTTKTTSSEKMKPASKKVEAVKEDKTKRAVGRKNTRGKEGEDYKMMNIAVPMDVYEKLREACNGNMTYYINAILKESVTK